MVIGRGSNVAPIMAVTRRGPVTVPIGAIVAGKPRSRADL
jgi:hypothetical protein